MWFNATLLVLITFALAVADTSVISLFLIDLNGTPQSLVGSIMAEVSFDLK